MFMKSLLVASAHGGTGRTALVCQFAYYLRLVRGYRVLVIDLAEPACSAESLAHGARARMMDREPATPRICVLAAHAIAGLICRHDPDGARCYANLRHVLSRLTPSFDVCLIDSPPWPDPRAVCAAALADALVSPVLLSPDVPQCVATFINGIDGVRNVRARLNPSLHVIGIVPNGVEPTPWQQAQLTRIKASLSAWLVPDAQAPTGYVCLPRLDVIAQAQACGISIAELARDDAAAHTAWHTLSACFEAIARRLDRAHETTWPAHCPEVCDA
jgi:chromosome partitioning protein